MELIAGILSAIVVLRGGWAVFGLMPATYD